MEEAEEDAWFRVVEEQEDGATAGTDGLLGLGRVLPDKGAPCSVLRLLSTGDLEISTAPSPQRLAMELSLSIGGEITAQNTWPGTSLCLPI